MEGENIGEVGEKKKRQMVLILVFHPKQIVAVFSHFTILLSELLKKKTIFTFKDLLIDVHQVQIASITQTTVKMLIFK